MKKLIAAFLLAGAAQVGTPNMANAETAQAGIAGCAANFNMHKLMNANWFAQNYINISDYACFKSMDVCKKYAETQAISNVKQSRGTMSMAVMVSCIDADGNGIAGDGSNSRKWFGRDEYTPFSWQ